MTTQSEPESHPDPMRQARRRATGKKALLALLIGLAILFLWLGCLTCGSHPLVLDRITWPRMKTLVEDYLAAISAGDVEQAVGLACPSDRCRKEMHAQAERDVARLGQAEIRQIRTETGVNLFSNEIIAIAHVTFEYRRPGDPEWSEGRGTCYSSRTFPSRRYLEGCLWQE